MSTRTFRSWVRPVLLCLLLLMLAQMNCLAESASLADKLFSTFPDRPFIVYIQGMDTRGDQLIADKGNSDVNILACVDTKEHKILLLNTPRDYYYPLRGNPEYPDKLTHCGYYGIDCSIDTLNSLYDIKIDYYVKSGFNSFKNIIDALGGITVYSEYAFSHDGFDYQVGDNYMDGAKALSFARERYHLPGGDRGRGKNQQKVITEIVRKVTSPEMYPHALELFNVFVENIQTDIPLLAATQLLQDQIQTQAAWSVESIQADGPGGWDYCYSLKSSNDVVYVDQESVDAAKAKVKAFMEGE